MVNFFFLTSLVHHVDQPTGFSLPLPPPLSLLTFALTLLRIEVIWDRH